MIPKVGKCHSEGEEEVHVQVTHKDQLILKEPVKLEKEASEEPVNKNSTTLTKFKNTVRRANQITHQINEDVQGEMYKNAQRSSGSKHNRCSAGRTRSRCK